MAQLKQGNANAKQPGPGPVPRPSLHSVTDGEHRLTAAAEQLGLSLGSLMRFLADKQGHNEYDTRHSQSLRVAAAEILGLPTARSLIAWPSRTSQTPTIICEDLR